MQLVTTGDAKPTRRAVLGTYYTVSEVAEKLEWSTDTIRRHLVPITDWEAGSGKIPCKRRGSMYLIPAWWLRSWLDDAAGPPREEGR